MRNMQAFRVCAWGRYQKKSPLLGGDLKADVIDFYLTFGWISNWWNGGGEDTVHSSVRDCGCAFQ